MEGVVVLALNGQLTVGEGDVELRGNLSRLCQSGKIKIVLNLSDVDHIDDSGLGALKFAIAKLSKAGGRLALSNINSPHLKFFLLTNLPIAVEFFDDNYDAVDSFFPERSMSPLKHLACTTELGAADSARVSGRLIDHAGPLPVFDNFEFLQQEGLSNLLAAIALAGARL